MVAGHGGRVQRWEAYPFGATVVLSLFAFFLPGPSLPEGPPVSDKLEHAGIFLALVLTGRFAGYAARPLAYGLAAYAVASELLQAVLPIHRTGDLGDLLADAAGIALGLYLAHLGGRALHRLDERNQRARYR